MVFHQKRKKEKGEKKSTRQFGDVREMQGREEKTFVCKI